MLSDFQAKAKPHSSTMQVQQSADQLHSLLVHVSSRDSTMEFAGRVVLRSSNINPHPATIV